MKRIGKRVSEAELKKLLRYEPDTGDFYRLSGPDKGKKAGTDSAQYYLIGLKTDTLKGIFYAHHLAWVYMTGTWPEKEVDHKDANKKNNKWENLRLATSSQQKQNSLVRSQDIKTSQYKGVFWLKTESKWVAKICVNKTRKYLGRFRREEDAALAYRFAAHEHFGDFARVE